MTELDELTTVSREREVLTALARGRLPDPLPFFSKIQIQTTSYCNAHCPPCPYPETAATQPMGRMSPVLFEHLLEQMAGRGVERTSLFLMNEPLVDRRLESFTRTAKEILPDTTVTIMTNGSLLTGARAVDLAEAGMGEVSVSVNGFAAADYEHLMAGLDHDKLMHNLDEVGAAARLGELGDMVVRVVALDVGPARQRAGAFERRTGLPVYLRPVGNRGGAIDAESFRSAPLCRDERRVCQRPFVKAYVLYNGDMVLCNNDWRRTTVVGNVLDRPIAALWQDAALQDVRRQHLRGRFQPGSLCAGCDYPYLSGG